MELKDTIELMTSDDYKDRFRAEYWQTKIRFSFSHSLHNPLQHPEDALDTTAPLP